MVGHQVCEHRAVALGVEDALDDGVAAAVEGMPGNQADQADVRAAGDVPLTQHLTAQQVLSDDRQAPAVRGADPGGGARLPGAAWSAHRHQHGACAARPGIDT
ncbi:hypothetical protein ACFQ0T_38035 [Kitasatospora gansuensis]